MRTSHLHRISITSSKIPPPQHQLIGFNPDIERASEVSIIRNDIVKTKVKRKSGSTLSSCNCMTTSMRNTNISFDAKSHLHTVTLPLPSSSYEIVSNDKYTCPQIQGAVRRKSTSAVITTPQNSLEDDGFRESDPFANNGSARTSTASSSRHATLQIHEIRAPKDDNDGKYDNHGSSSSSSSTTTTTTTTEVQDRQETNHNKCTSVLSVNSENINLAMGQILHDYHPGTLPSSMVSTSIQAIQFWIRTNSDRGISSAAKILSKLLHELLAGNEQVTFRMDQTLDVILHAGRKFGNEHFSQTIALDLWNQINDLLTHGLEEIKDELKPTIKTCNMLMDILSKSGRDDAIPQMEQVLYTAQHHWNIQPDAFTYNTLLHAHSQKNDDNPGKRCETLLRKMQQSKQLSSSSSSSLLSSSLVDTVSYNIVMNAWGKTRKEEKAASRAEMLLREMLDSYTEGNAQVKPNFISFTTVIAAWGKSTELEAADRAEYLLQLMQELHQKGDVQMKPSIVTYNAVLNAWSKSKIPGAAHRAEELLKKMIGMWRKEGNVDAKPDNISFSICINAWGNSDEVGSSDRALGLLKQMQQLHSEEKEQEAESDSYSDSNSNSNLVPDTVTFNAVLRCLANDSDPQKASKAESILTQMESFNCFPDLQTYNNVLKCCCSTKSNQLTSRRNTLRIATMVLTKIRQSKTVLADPYTFNFFIKVCDRLSEGAEKFKLIKAAFLFCVESGQFSPPVLSLLKNALKPNELKQLLTNVGNGNARGGAGGNIDIDIRKLQFLKVSDFPPAWSARSKTKRRGGSQQSKERLLLRRNGRRHRRPNGSTEGS